MAQNEQEELVEQREAWAGCGEDWKTGDELGTDRKLELEHGLYSINKLGDNVYLPPKEIKVELFVALK